MTEPHSTTEPSTNEIEQFSTELRNLAAAGIPLQFDIGPNLESEIAKESPLAANYQSALEIWLRCDRSPVALDSMTAMAIRNQSSHRTLSLALVQPIVLLVVAYLSLIYISSSTIPKIEAIYQQLEKPPGFGLWVMSWIRSSMPVWIIIIPTLAAAWIVYRWVKPDSITQSGLFQTNQKYTYLQNAIDSNQLAELLAYDCSLAESKSLIVPVHPSVSTGTSPLLSWAISEKSSPSKVNQLRSVSRTYRFLDQLRVQQYRSWLPALVIGAFGGAIVLAIGLSVFVPVVELLRDLSMPSER